jgi:uroporphyrin-3 C-methyltransferase
MADDGDGPDIEPEEASEASTEVSPAAKPRGRWLGVLGFLTGAAGLAVGGYLYYLLVYMDPQSSVDARLIGVESRVEERAREIAELERRQREALAAFADDQQRERDESAERLLEAVNQLATQAPPSRREWKVAEVAYLLRIANHRLLMERDAEGALALLRGADAILVELDDFSLFQVRAQLSDEILSLENVESSDVQGLFLRLEAVKTELGRQSLKLPRFETSETAAEEEQGFWAAMVAQLGNYLRFRRFDGDSVKPLLAPEEATYLELNLRLMVERAQLAALRREQVVFEQSLQTAADWISTYLDLEEPGIQRALGELDTMSAVQLDVPMPDISGSLTTLKSMGEA